MPLKLYRRKGSDNWHYAGTVGEGKHRRRLRGSTRTADRPTAERIALAREQREWKRSIDGPEAVTRFSDAVALYRDAGKPTERFVLKLLDYWQETPIRDLTAGRIRESCRILYPNAGAATFNRQVITPTASIINHAASLELCQPIRVGRFPVESREKPAATWAWVSTFAQASNTPEMSALAILLFATGARISESLSLAWSDVDFSQRTIRIRSTKTGTERVANMPMELVTALANLPEPHVGRVFPWKTRKSVYDRWYPVCEAAGIKPLSPHSLRHGFATTLLQKGVDVKTVMHLGGWKDPSLFLRTYAHAMKDPRITDRLTESDASLSQRNQKMTTVQKVRQ